MTSATPLFGRVCLLGVGLIGGSLAINLREKSLAREIVGVARRQETREQIKKLGLADTVTGDAAEAVRDSDLIIFCTPVGSYAALGEAISGAFKKGAIITDVGSVKNAVIRDLGPFVPEGVHFVPGHPIAGTEHSGPAAAFGELFEDRYCILTPPPGTDDAAVKKVQALWEACGSTVQIMDAAHHDKVLGITSHLPHLIAYTIVATAQDLEEATRQEVIRYSASGFRDFTRIAASDPIMWRDIFLNNREAVLEILQRFTEDLTALQRAIRWGEGDVLETLFTRTREIRRGVVELGQAGTFDTRERKTPEESED
ncbi:prephenate/arogenate dehydrogenase family protein [Limibacillus sp. MBR-115]|jgi:cyclohexadieny/prephenate dehydrogenase|uniref:prephenate/arogenate dehydrogenase family protein n=1 Tax=Limibacillus sp. MBR-115 TaxID=3156465 RepID=UPI003393C3EF